ncbi:hypothetical protein DMENIID0001_136350 [Sergentomyia squamirostris]
MAFNEPEMTVTGDKNKEIFGSMFPEMLSGRKFVDVTLAVEGRRIQCHRVILAAYSSYFSDLLEENPSQHPIIIFSGEIKFWMIQDLVEFMYRGEVSVKEDSFEDLMKCAEILKIQGFNTVVMSPFENRKEEVINEFQPEDFDVEDTEFIYPRELVRPKNPPLEGENSRDSSLMNRSADSDPEMLNRAHVERKRSDPCQRKTLRNYRISGKMETENTSMDSEDETENSFREKKKIDIIPFVSSPEDFVLPQHFNKQRLFDKDTMWSALMSVKNGMSAHKASKKYKLSSHTLKNYMKKYDLLEENPAQHPIVILPRDVKFWAIKALVEYMYRGEVTVTGASYGGLMKCAKLLQIRGITRAESQITRNSETSNDDERNQEEQVDRNPEENPSEIQEKLIDEIKAEVIDEEFEETQVVQNVDPLELLLPTCSNYNLSTVAAKREMRQSSSSSASSIPGHNEGLADAQTIDSDDDLMDLDEGKEETAEFPVPSTTKEKIKPVTFVSPPKDFVLQPGIKHTPRTYDAKDMWSALMSVKGGLSAHTAAKIYKIPNRTLYTYMKKHGITSSIPQPAHLTKYQHELTKILKCARTLKIQGFIRAIMSQFENRENRNQRIESERSLPQESAAHPEQVLIDEFKMDVLDVEDTEISYPRELVHPENPTLEGENSGDSSLMNRSAESDPEINPTHVERKKPKRRQRKTLRNYRTSGEMETENTSMDSEDETENSFRKERKIDKIPFGPPPKDFVLPPYNHKRSFDKNTMWSALMCVQNGMSTRKASQKFKLNDRTIRLYMEKYELIDEFKTEVLDVEDTEFIYLRELIHPQNPPQVPDNEPIREIRNSGESSLMNKFAENVSEPSNPVHVERKKPNQRQQKTSQNYRNSEKMKTENSSTDSEDDEAENSSRKKKKISKISFGTPPKNFVLPLLNRQRSYNRTDMWSALMSVKNGMSLGQAAQKFKMSNGVLYEYMKKYEILGSSFPEMLSGQKFVDMTLAVEGRRIQCHRLVLAAYSSYFSDLLEENPGQHPIIIFSGEIKFWMIQALVEFMYRGEVSVREDAFEDLMKCAETLKIQGFNRNQISENSFPQKEAAYPEQVLINEIKTEVFDVEDTEFIYPSELVHPVYQPQAAENSGHSSLMNRSAEIVPEINPVHVEGKKTKRRQRKTLRNYRTSGEMETQNSSRDSEDETGNSSLKKKNNIKFHFGPPPEDFVLRPYFNKKERSFDKNTMWSALMSVKNGMSIYKAAREFKLNDRTIRIYMKKYDIKSKFKAQGALKKQ